MTSTWTDKMQDLDDYLCLDDIVCYDADVKPFEHYHKLWVRKDVERDAKGTALPFTSYEGTAYLENQGLFSPSLALTCAIVQALYERRSDAEANKVLMTYKGEKGRGTNTIIRWKRDGNASIVHYPKDKDYTLVTKEGGLDEFFVGTWDIRTGTVHIPKEYYHEPHEEVLQYGGSSKINMGRKRTEFSFKYWLRDYYWSGDAPDTDSLQEALHTPKFERFIKNLTGLRKPQILVDIATYFGHSAHADFKLYGEDCSDAVTSTCFGGDYFSLFSGLAGEKYAVGGALATGAMQKVWSQLRYANHKYSAMKRFFEEKQKQLLKK